MADKITYLKGASGKVPVRLYLIKNRYRAYFPYDAQLKDDIKFMKGSRWDPEEKCWTFPRNRRNDFQLAYLMGVPVYDRYDSEVTEESRLGGPFKRTLFDHQKDIVDFVLHRKQCIVAAEMGTGKTLAGIEVLERVHLHGVPWWVGPKLTLSTVELELDKWECKVAPHLITYDKMKKWVEEGVDVPNVVIFDESSKLKGHTSQRTKSAIELGNQMREAYEDPYIVLLSGRPAPNAPVDWWAQAEVACPGFLREGKYAAFEDRLCYKIEHQRLGGATFRKIEGWWDDSKKCRTCHEKEGLHKTKAHPWVPSVNEVEKLERRLRGLVMTVFKKDCLDLPAKNYLRLKIKPNPRAKMIARQIRQESATPGDMMYRLRALSDGYVVKDVKSDDTQPCGHCSDGWVPDIGGRAECNICKGTGVLCKYSREYHPIMSPKIQAFAQVLDNYAEHGRLIAWAPLHGTLELLRDTAVKHGWDVLRFDGKKVEFIDTTKVFEKKPTEKEMLVHFQEGSRDNKCVFIGNPEAAGMGLTLTAADAMVFYSNSWKPEARSQAEDRIHRPGSTGARIIDIVCMPIDEVIREALVKKEELQDMSLGKIQERLQEVEEEW